VGVSVAALGSERRRLRRGGAVALTAALVWGLDEAVALGKSELWSTGQLFALGAALGLVGVSGLIGREIWPDRPLRALAVGGFVTAYPVVLRLGSLFHPETSAAFLSSIAILLVIRAGRRRWPVRLGALAGAACGLALLTRQSAIVVLVCVALLSVVSGGRDARRFVLVLLATSILVAGPWLGYAAYTWGNPLQGNLQRPGDMIAGGEPRSFFVSFPLRTLVLHPYRPDFANELLPQLHADLWSDWFGAYHTNHWRSASRLDRATASTQSVLGFVGDALALGGLTVIGLPALVRTLRKRKRRQRDPALALLALVALAGFAAFTAQVTRYPQIDGVELKASYLMFAVPAFAVFSVGTWLRLARWRSTAGWVLALSAVLYAVSYGTSLAATFEHRYDAQPHLVLSYGYVDLQLSLQGPSQTVPVDNEPTLNLTVENVGTESAGRVVLTIQLDPSMRLLGPPYHERGPGCTGTQTVTCQLDFLPPGVTTPVRLGVELTRAGLHTITASVTSYELDAHPADNRQSIAIPVAIP
jgi:4-amino-4-deoxy-L-arabinose transferase-like glycosyltransferase